MRLPSKRQFVLLPMALGRGILDRLVARSAHRGERSRHVNEHTADRAALETLMSNDLRALAAEADSIGRVFARSQDVTPTDFYGLLQVMVAETAGAPLSAGGLRQRMGFSSAAITYLVERMIIAGHIRREPHPSDHRKVILRYEPRGLELARSFFAPLGAHTRSAIVEFSNEDLATAHQVFDALTDGMRRFRDDIAAPSDQRHDPQE
jgi:DNA-binding MarR family transcriptional regulator